MYSLYQNEQKKEGEKTAFVLKSSIKWKRYKTIWHCFTSRAIKLQRGLSPIDITNVLDIL